jgi:peptidoglycan biosynthesis protein MviN/MurJ (putative lipid II flippase)
MVSIMLVLRLPIVRLTFGVGEFDWRATILTSWCLVFLSLAILGQTLSQIILRAFYALKKTWKPLVAVGIGILVNILFAFLLTNFFSHYYDWRPILQQVVEQVATANGNGVVSVIKSFFSDLFVWCTTRGTSDMAVGGLSTSLSIASFIELLLLAYLLNKEVKVITFGETIKPMLKKLLNGILMAVGMYLVFRLFDFKLDTTRTFSIIILTIITSLYGLLSYWLGSKVFGIEEINYFEEKVKNIWTKITDKIRR